MTRVGASHFDASVLDPSDLALTGWFRASYGGAPWVGEASAGTSGAKSATSPGAAPTVGTAVNGHTPADYNGTTQYLRDIISTGPDYISTTAYRVVMLIEPGTLSAPAGAVYDDRGLFVETGGNWGITANTSVISVYHYSGAYKVASAPIVAGKQVVDIRYDGTDLKLAINGVEGTPDTAGTLASIATDLRLGANYSAGSKYAGTILEFISCDDDLPGTTPADFLAYFNQRYALSL